MQKNMETEQHFGPSPREKTIRDRRASKEYLKNNPPRIPHTFVNDEEGIEYHQLCVMRLSAPPLVEMLLRCPPCLQTASHAVVSSILE